MRNSFSELGRHLARLIHARREVIWTVILGIIFVIFLMRERANVVWVLRSLRTADWRWVLGSMVVGLALQVPLGVAVGPILGCLGSKVGWIPLVRVQFQRHVVAALVPVGAPASMYVFLRGMRRQGVDSETALYASLVNSVLGYASFIVLLLPIFVILLLQGHLSPVMLWGTIALLSVMAFVAGGLFIFLRAGPWIRPLRRRIPARVETFIARARAYHLSPRDLITPLVIHLIVDLAGVVLLYSCLRAVHLQPSLGTVMIGYTIGTLFLLVTPILHGLGAVELSMTVALHSLGIPSAAAFAAVLLYRVTEVWVPLFLGLSFQAGESRELRRASARLPALMTSLTGFITAVAAVSYPFPTYFDQLREYSMVNSAESTRTFTSVAGVLLMLLSWSLWRRKRVAWIAALVVLVLSVTIRLFERPDEFVLVFSGLTLALLIIHRNQFKVRSDVPTLRQGILRSVFGVLIALGYGTIGFFVMDERAFGMDFSGLAAIQATFRTLFSLGTYRMVPHTRTGSWFLASLTSIGIVMILNAAFSLIRPVVWRRHTLASEREEARYLIVRHGDSSLDFFKSATDKLYFFSSTRQGVVAYGSAHSCAIALGDPVATNAEEFERVLSEFLEFCDANDWSVAFHQVPTKRLTSYTAAGLSVFKIGEDAIINVNSFSLHGRSMRAMRSGIHRLERAGYRARLSLPPHSEQLLDCLREVSTEWLNLPGRRERGFTLGVFDLDYLRTTPVMLVEDVDGHALAFANIIPDGASGEATIDLMRRRADLPNGIMDLLQLRLIEHFRAQGYHHYSLGLVPFSNVGNNTGAPMIELAIRHSYRHLGRFFSYNGLLHYKEKFHPEWDPRYFAYAPTLALPRLVLVLTELTERPPNRYLRGDGPQSEKQVARRPGLTQWREWI